MSRLRFACALCLALSFPIAALAQAPAEDPAADATGTTWTSSQGTDATTDTRYCSVYPLSDHEGAFPMFFFFGPDVEMSLEGTKGTPMGLKLQVDANPELDGGFPKPAPKAVATLMQQIRANGRSLRLSRMVVTNGKLGTAVDEVPLAGAVEQFDACLAWVSK